MLEEHATALSVDHLPRARYGKRPRERVGNRMAWTMDLMTSTKRAAIGALALAFTLEAHHAFAQQNAPQPEAPARSEKSAAALVEQGKAAFTAGNMHEALRAFREAWDIAKTSQIAANLGTIEGNFGQHRDAAEHLQFALSHLSNTATDAQKSAISDALNAEKRHVLTLLVHGAPPGTVISIDNKAVATTPIPDEIYVEPGEYSARAECPKYQGETRAITGVAGETVEVLFELTPASDAGAMPAAGLDSESTPPPAASTNKPSPVILTLGGSVALLGIATGTIFAIAGVGASRDAQDARDALPYNASNACGAGTPYVSECQALADANRAIDRDRTIMVTGYVVAGAATMGTLVYGLWPRKHTNASFGAVPSITPKYAGVQAGWRW
ncbi:MAG TPA: PEGA domain-containing protein [Polyangiaceae bacterium]|nr:PEGA domain-containing protein [Polyangiaceae bacterium]